MTLWKQQNGWRYECFEPDTDPSTFPHFEDLVRLWQSKRQGRRVPSKKDFDFYDFKGWHGWLVLYDVKWDPFDYVVRLSGTQVDELYGFGATGFDRQKMNEVYEETTVRDEFDEMNCRNLTISRISGPLNIKGKGFQRVVYLELPLSEDGNRASATIEAVVPLKSGEE
jgi:hypothetical protein